MIFLRPVLYFLVGFSCIWETSTGSKDREGAIEGYYWRHYTGKVPLDALPGGADSKGRPTYVGQTVYNGILVPGQINEQEQQLYFEWGDREHKARKHVKILCTKQPERFEWIRTNKDEIMNLTEKNFVLGGFERNYTVYIGRVQIDDELTVGKVIVTDDRPAGFHTVNNGTFVHVTSFEVLNYDADIPDVAEIRDSLAGRQMYRDSSAVRSGFCFFGLILIVTHLFLK